MAETPYLVDSNVLLRWVRPEHTDYPVTVSAMDALLRRDAVLCYTSQNVAEFWNTCTRPVDRNGYSLSPQDADRTARSFEERLRLLADSLAVHQEWRRLLVTHGVSGVRVHDARLVAAMHVHGINYILTFNGRDFARYNDIEAVHPAASLWPEIRRAPTNLAIAICKESICGGFGQKFSARRTNWRRSVPAARRLGFGVSFRNCR